MPQIARAEELLIDILTLDVNDPASVEAAFEQAGAEGPIDVLVNNAGILHMGPFKRLPIEGFEDTVQTNYLGAIRCIKQVLPEMRKRRGGAIINLTSVAGRIAFGSVASYNGAKFALEGRQRSWRSRCASTESRSRS